MDWIYVKKQEYWFVLTEDSLNGFKDKDEKEQLYHVALAELQFSCDKKTIILYQLIG